MSNTSRTQTSTSDYTRSSRNDSQSYDTSNNSTSDCNDHHDDCRDDNCHGCRTNSRNNCGLRSSSTPVGVWNLIYQYDINTMNNMNNTNNTNNNMNNNTTVNNNRTTVTTMNGTTVTVNGTTIANDTNNMIIERPTQLLLNAGGTLVNVTTPDLNNNPFGALLSTGLGVWREIGDRKIRLDETHIAYRTTNGAPTVYYKVKIIMKLNSKGTRARFFGQATPKDITDPNLCTDSNNNAVSFCFSGCAYKVLEPRNSK